MLCKNKFKILLRVYAIVWSKFTLTHLVYVIFTKKSLLFFNVSHFNSGASLLTTQNYIFNCLQN